MAHKKVNMVCLWVAAVASLIAIVLAPTHFVPPVGNLATVTPQPTRFVSSDPRTAPVVSKAPSLEATPVPTQLPPATNRVSWKTEAVSLEANNFYVQAGAQVFMGNPAMVVRSDPGDGKRTTLELTWFEKGVEMRLNLYLDLVDNRWRVSEVRSYNGKAPGDWIFYPGFRALDMPYRTALLELPGLPHSDPHYNTSGLVHFEDLRLEVRPNLIQAR